MATRPTTRKKTAAKSKKAVKGNKVATKKISSKTRKKPSKKASAKKKPASKKKATAKKTPAKKAATKKKSSSKKTSVKKSVGKKPATKTKASPKKSVVKKAAAKKKVVAAAVVPVAAPKKKLPKAIKMKAPELKKFRNRLIGLGAQLTGQVAQLHGDSLTREDSVVSEDDGTDASDREFALTVASSEQDALYEIQEALRRIDAKTYGICETCEQNIEGPRLQAIPYVRLCIKCKSELERDSSKIRHTSSLFL